MRMRVTLADREDARSSETRIGVAVRRRLRLLRRSVDSRWLGAARSALHRREIRLGARLGRGVGLRLFEQGLGERVVTERTRTFAAFERAPRDVRARRPRRENFL